MEKVTLTAEQLAKIDYTLLDHQATEQAIIALCEKAIQYNVASVCVMPEHVLLANHLLKGSSVLVCTVISFPEGTNSIAQKVQETKDVLNWGAQEIDMVINYQQFDQNEEVIKEEIRQIQQITQAINSKAIVKVIVESGCLTIEQTKKATEICIAEKVEFIKT